MLSAETRRGALRITEPVTSLRSCRGRAGKLTKPTAMFMIENSRLGGVGVLPTRIGGSLHDPGNQGGRFALDCEISDVWRI